MGDSFSVQLAFSIYANGQLAATVSDLKVDVENTNNSLNALKAQLADLGLLSSGRCIGEGAHMSCCTNASPCGLGEGKYLLLVMNWLFTTEIIFKISIGDCDNNNDCIGNLVCHDNLDNCPDWGIDAGADCCKLP